MKTLMMEKTTIDNDMKSIYDLVARTLVTNLVGVVITKALSIIFKRDA